MSRSDPQFNLRIPEALRDKVMAAASENKRSATAEILARLEESFLSTPAANFTIEQLQEIIELSSLRTAEMILAANSRDNLVDVVERIDPADLKAAVQRLSDTGDDEK